jgi:hypothetical protein
MPDADGEKPVFFDNLTVQHYTGPRNVPDMLMAHFRRLNTLIINKIENSVIKFPGSYWAARLIFGPLKCL